MDDIGSDLNSSISIDEPLSPQILIATRALYAAPHGDAYWAQLEARVMSRISNSAAAGWWVVVGGWARGGLAAAAGLLIATVVGLLLMRAHNQEVRVAYESATQIAPAEPVAIPAGALSERDGPDARGATFRDVISQ